MVPVSTGWGLQIADGGGLGLAATVYRLPGWAQACARSWDGWELGSSRVNEAKAGPRS